VIVRLKRLQKLSNDSTEIRTGAGKVIEQLNDDPLGRNQLNNAKRSAQFERTAMSLIQRTSQRDHVKCVDKDSPHCFLGDP
jgi:hypothetical protein